MSRREDFFTIIEEGKTCAEAARIFVDMIKNNEPINISQIGLAFTLSSDFPIRHCPAIKESKEKKQKKESKEKKQK